MTRLHGKKIVSVATNLPGPTACYRLAQWGAKIVKIEPLTGDQLFHFYPQWYHRLSSNQHVIKLDLKDEIQRNKLDEILMDSNLLITSHMNHSLKKMKLNWEELQRTHPKLSLLQIFSYPDENRPGHDLNFQLNCSGLIDPPNMPKSLYADLIGAERITSIAVMSLFSNHPTLEKVFLCDPIKELSYPIDYQATTLSGPLGGKIAVYNLYQCLDGWVALCALEIHFQILLKNYFGISELTYEKLSSYFSSMTVKQTLEWGRQLGVPISSTKEFDPIESNRNE